MEEDYTLDTALLELAQQINELQQRIAMLETPQTVSPSEEAMGMARVAEFYYRAMNLPAHTALRLIGMDVTPEDAVREPVRAVEPEEYAETVVASMRSLTASTDALKAIFETAGNDYEGQDSKEPDTSETDQESNGSSAAGSSA